MAKPQRNRSHPEQPEAPSGSVVSATGGWPRWARVFASAAILFHLSAVVAAVLVAAPPFSDLWVEIAGIFRPYVNAADLNHGYRFFAPEPGPGHLVEYHLQFADGTTRDGRFPNLDEERPRLLYHRYFMLSEHLATFYGVWRETAKNSRDESLPEPVRTRQGQIAAANKKSYQALGESYARELLRRTGAKSVTLKLIEHRIPFPDEVTRGMRLDDKSLYLELEDSGLGPFSAQGVPEELP